MDIDKTKITQTSVICSEHFHQKYFSVNPKCISLKKDALPFPRETPDIFDAVESPKKESPVNVDTALDTAIQGV